MIIVKVKKEKFKLAASSLMIAMSIVLVPQALAEELTISNNGANSESKINVTSSSNTDVQQNNNADVKNDVKVEANTGENTASNNTGGSTTIETGNAQSSTSINNTANVSSVNVEPCNGCESHGSITINGNGAFSTNNVNLKTFSNNNVTVNQDANIWNSVDEKLITGKNNANDNTDGDVVIQTGDIRSRVYLLNDKLNFSDISIAGSPFHDFLISVFGNGAFSENNVKTKFDNDNDVTVNNALTLINHLKNRYVTGENDANFNTHGNVAITTGDIDSDVKVKNVANINKVTIACNCPEKVTPTPTPAQEVSPTSVSAPTVAPTGAPAAAAAASPTPAPERVLGAAAEILPVTGSNLFFFMLIGNIMMLLSGAYLRLRSGNSPGINL